MVNNKSFYADIRQLRSEGFTYAEINEQLNTAIPKSSLSYICKGIVLTTSQLERIDSEARAQLVSKREKAVLANRKKHEDKLASYRAANQDLMPFMQDRRAKMIALAMLYLGEGAKWQKSRAPKLASTDPMIIRLYILLLGECYGVTIDTLRCRVQQRADQNSDELIVFWSEVTGIPRTRFYPSYIDKRTVGHKTTKASYHGVCTIMCAGTHIQLELAEIAGIIYRALNKGH